MAQLFTPRENLLAKIGVILLIAVPTVIGLFAWEWTLSYRSGVRMAVQQPVPFSHAHHVGGLGIDCRYCHTSVEVSSFAGLPPSEICMNCHAQIWTNAAMLAPVRQSWANNRPIRWQRVNRLADFVYFNHSIHIAEGIGCESCHGRVDRMPLMWKAQNLYMSFCLDCHRHPEKFVRPREEVFSMVWTRPADDPDLGRRLVRQYGIDTRRLTNCTMCHR